MVPKIGSREWLLGNGNRCSAVLCGGRSAAVGQDDPATPLNESGRHGRCSGLLRQVKAQNGHLSRCMGFILKKRKKPWPHVRGRQSGLPASDERLALPMSALFSRRTGGRPCR